MQGLGATAPKQIALGDTAPEEPPFDCTEFVAETLLPTVSGKYRLRGYRHTVSYHPMIHGMCNMTSSAFFTQFQSLTT